MELYIIDAFSKEMFGGNPAGVVICDQDFPSEEFMIKLANELRYSETAFVKFGNQINIRYFTPTCEVDLCGHATIASFVALRDLKMVSNDNEYLCHTKAGQISVSVDSEKISMSMGKAEIFKTIAEKPQIEMIYNVMGLKYDEVYYNSQILLPQIVSTGLADMMLPVKDIETLNKIKPDFKKLAEISKEYNMVGVHAFAITLPENTAHCRNFAPLYDIDEESATGTSNGALSYYLYDKNIVSKDMNLTYVQGEKMNRPSVISAEIKEINQEIVVFVGGDGVIISKGKLMV